MVKELKLHAERQESELVLEVRRCIGRAARDIEGRVEERGAVQAKLVGDAVERVLVS